MIVNSIYQILKLLLSNPFSLLSIFFNSASVIFSFCYTCKYNDYFFFNLGNDLDGC